ncbi:MAG: hypothetical protein L0H73_06715 [Nitrococcus sp.]|nr:hypothetical protein [Nitrococcus sp.]
MRTITPNLRGSALKAQVAGGEITARQPVLWLTEVAAVLVRLSPITAQMEKTRRRFILTVRSQ